MTKEELMHEAIALSIDSIRHGGGPFGAVIARDGEIIAAASNSVTKDHDPTAHAEVNAIRIACGKLQTFDLQGCESIVPVSLVRCVWVLSTGPISTRSIMPTRARTLRALASTTTSSITRSSFVPKTAIRPWSVCCRKRRSRRLRCGRIAKIKSNINRFGGNR